MRRSIEGDESAKEMLARVLTGRPCLVLPPLHRVPLRVGNVVEILGPSPSAKTRILIQAAINCILPKDCNGVYYGGLEHAVMFVDLDCHFDILHFSQSLKRRINEAKGSRTNVRLDKNEVDAVNLIAEKDPLDVSDKDLYAMCLRRFLYVRCYDSLQFLATLKTMHYQLQKQSKKHGVGVHLLMIDSIGAFYWIDRGSTSLPLGGVNRRGLSLQTVSDTVVQEIQKLLLVHPMLVLATKAANLGDKYLKNEVKRKWFSQKVSCLRTVRSDPHNLSYREYMPSVWQNFVTHRILVRPSDDDNKHPSNPTFLSEWLLPSLSVTDKFTVRDNGIFIVS